MRPPDVHGVAIPVAPLRARRRRRLRLPAAAISTRSCLVILGATAVLAASLAVATQDLRSGGASRPAFRPGTAFLGTATCADWREASVERRKTIVASLGVAATQPDPESAGATLQAGAAYGVLERACSTRLSRSFLLYEVYNRAASFRSAAGVRAPGGSAPGHP
jgi:hypothetical protein